MNSSDIILQTKFRNPIAEDGRGEYNWEWSNAPITITRKGDIRLTGYLNTQDAVDKDNIKENAVTENKIDHWSIRGVADPEAPTNEDEQDDLIKKSQIKKGTITDWNIANNTITLNKLNKNIKITADYIDVGTILPSYTDVEDESKRPIKKGMIQSEAIVHSKLYKSKDKTEAADSEPPVWGENIKDESIEFNHMKNPNDYEPVIEDEMKYPVNGKAHIQKRSIPLNRLSEPIYTLEQNTADTNDYFLILYPINGGAKRYYGNQSIIAWEAEISFNERRRQQAISDGNPSLAKEYKKLIEQCEEYIRNAEKGYYIKTFKDTYNPNTFNWDSTFYEDDSSEQEENVEP